MTAPTLLVIDVQKGLDAPSLGERSTPQAETNIARLLAEWRRRELPIVHVQHSSVEAESTLRPELPGHDFKDEARPVAGEKVFNKSVNSAFIGTGLEGYLRERGASSLIVVGLTTDHCVSASTRNAASVCRRSSRTISRSCCVPSLILKSGQLGNSCILATIFSIVSMPIV